MGNIISNIENEYQDYIELCKKFYIKPVDIMNSTWLTHQRQLELKDFINKEKCISYDCSD